MVLHSKSKDVPSSADDPPFSRLFVVYNRKDPMTEAEIRIDFEQYGGDVQDIFIVEDKSTGEQKGVAYVKFSKMSDAALAMENLNNMPITNHSGVYRVHIAKSRNESKNADQDDPDRYLRLFVIVPKIASETDVREYFSKFGTVQTVKLLRFKETNESKGIGYVTFSRVFEAAKAVEDENNDNGYKAVIARPKEKYVPQESTIPSANRSYHHRSSTDVQSNADFFQATVSSKLTKDQVFRLFDIAPGLRNIRLVSKNGYRSEITATYNSTLAAEYALNKLHGLEYPLGEFIAVESKTIEPTLMSTPSSSSKRDYHGDHIDFRSDSSVETTNNTEVDIKLSALSKALSDATALLKSAGLATESMKLNSYDGDPKYMSQYCNQPLPAPQKTVPKSLFNEATGMRLFIVGHPAAPSLDALYDVYCRFGNFAGASILQRKNYGYLYFTSPESAQRAIDATDDKIIDHMTIKVLIAEPKGEPSTKRKRLEH